MQAAPWYLDVNAGLLAASKASAQCASALCVPWLEEEEAADNGADEGKEGAGGSPEKGAR